MSDGNEYYGYDIAVLVKITVVYNKKAKLNFQCNILIDPLNRFAISDFPPILIDSTFKLKSCYLSIGNALTIEFVTPLIK